MLGNRIMCLLSATLLFTSCNMDTQTPWKATEVVKYNNIEMIHNSYEMFKVQYEKDKAESERIKVEKEKKDELKIIEEQKQKQRDLDCYYNPNNVSEISRISVQKAYKLLENTTYQSYECAEEFVNAEKLNPSVNALFLISLTKLESNYGKSNLSNIHNISSWRASRGWRGFNSKSDCIKQTAKMISNAYLKTNGEYYKGMDIWSINKNYCEGGNKWSKDINIIANEIRK